MNVRLNGVPELTRLKNVDGVSWGEFRRTLRPRFMTILVNVIVAWSMIGAGLIGFVLLRNLDSFSMEFLAVPFGGLWFAFWVQAYTAHFHESAHFNLASNPKWNDLLSRVFLTPFIGLDVKSYRVSHWEHHKHLGDPLDTEISYHDALTPWRIVESFTGVYLARSFIHYLLNYRTIDRRSAPKPVAQQENSSFWGPLSYAMVVQALIVVALWRYVSPVSSIAWGVGFFLFGSFLSILRQTLEHRSLTAQSGVDFTQRPHGPANRIFGKDFISRHFGGAGFNRHLLHHWDPSLSYTRFDEMEAFLLKTEVADLMNSCRSTYWTTFKAMFQWR